MRDLAGRIAACTMLLFIIVEHDAVAADQSSPGSGNPVLSHMGAERPQILYAGSGVDAVAAELAKLKQAGVI
jgi:hypothetical protein